MKRKIPLLVLLFAVALAPAACADVVSLIPTMSHASLGIVLAVIACAVLLYMVRRFRGGKK